jgi:hypothetical protein
MTALAYGFLGLLVGVISGLTDSAISLTLFATLFTFVGGTAAYFLQMKPSERKLVSSVILSFSLCCLIGLLSGIYIKVNRVLDRPSAVTTVRPEQASSVQAQKPAAPAPGVPEQPAAVPAEKPVYFKANSMGTLDTIHRKYMRGQLSPKDAYEQTWIEIQNGRAKE